MITVSLETAKKLKEAGWNKQTHFVHKELRDIKYSGAKGMHYIHTMLPTAQEILDELPARKDAEITIRKSKAFDDVRFCAGYLGKNGIPKSSVENGVSTAEALANLRLRVK